MTEQISEAMTRLWTSDGGTSACDEVDTASTTGDRGVQNSQEVDVEAMVVPANMTRSRSAPN